VLFAFYLTDAKHCNYNNCKACSNAGCSWCNEMCISSEAKGDFSCNRITTAVQCLPRIGCIDNLGNKYDHGAGFAKGDGCNRCNCWDGVIECSTAICVGCEAILCIEGTVCQMTEKGPACLPTNSDPCAGVRCINGQCITSLDGAMSCIPPPTCEYNGLVYKSGDSFKAGDGCNTCSCNEKGGVICTKMLCTIGTCLYDGVTYFEGESFPSGDGCNSCSCSSGGNVLCTMRACQINTCSEDAACGVGSYCRKDTGSCMMVGPAIVMGTCQPRYELCISLYDPVCGCDGLQYSNACEAGSKGVNIRSVGPCPIVTTKG